MRQLGQPSAQPSFRAGLAMVLHADTQLAASARASTVSACGRAGLSLSASLHSHVSCSLSADSLCSLYHTPKR
jgi:hypothetical protein